MTHPLCLLRGLWRSIRTLWHTGYPCSGHNLVDLEVIRGATVTTHRCETCGEEGCSWTRGGQERALNRVAPCVVHCYHDTGYVLTSNPPQYPQRCCHCGQAGPNRVEPERVVPPGHGPFWGPR